MASRGDAELVRDHCELNCTHSLVTTLSLRSQWWIVDKTLFRFVVVMEFCLWFLWHTHRQHRGRSTLNIYFVLYFLLLPSDVHLSVFFCWKQSDWIKGLVEKKCVTWSTNNHYQNHLEDLYCWIVEYTLLYPLLNFPMHVWFWKSMCECSLKAIFC